MMLGAASWRSRSCRTALALSAVLVAGSAAQAQTMMHTPNLNMPPRVPTINPNVVHGDIPIVAPAPPPPNIAARVPTPNIPARVPTPTIMPRIVNPNLPTMHYSPNLYPSCGAAFRDSDGECLSAPVTATGGAAGGGAGASSGTRSGNVTS